MSNRNETEEVAGGQVPQPARFHPDCARGRREAFEAFFGVLDAAAELAEPLPSLVRRLLDELRRDDRGFVAHLTTKGVLFSYPSQAFLDACAAVLAWDFDEYEVDVRQSHGWPLLSLGCSQRPKRAGGEGESIPLPKGEPTPGLRRLRFGQMEEGLPFVGGVALPTIGAARGGAIRSAPRRLIKGAVR